MYFKDIDFVSEGLTTDDLVLRPIVAADAELDYAAVMESREHLRKWEQTSWPADDFTVTANREDLENLERRHASREAFTYTVMNPAETECLGWRPRRTACCLMLLGHGLRRTGVSEAISSSPTSSSLSRST